MRAAAAMDEYCGHDGHVQPLLLSPLALLVLLGMVAEADATGVVDVVSEVDEAAGMRWSVVVRTRGGAVAVAMLLVVVAVDTVAVTGPTSGGNRHSASARNASSMMMYATNETYMAGC
jgi:hypothetical protein